MAAAGEADRKNLIQVSRLFCRHPTNLPLLSAPALLSRQPLTATIFVQVAATRPVAFYASLAKKLLLDNANVELSAIGELVFFM